MGKWTGQYVESCDIVKWVIRWNYELADGTYRHSISMLCDLKDADGKIVAQDNTSAVLATTTEKLTTRECIDLLHSVEFISGLTEICRNTKNDLADESDAELVGRSR